MDEIGAHVSSAGGPHNTPARAAALNSNVLQFFTKMASRWAEPAVDEKTAELFRNEREAHGVCFAAAHDSYLINLATADAILFDRSCNSFQCELQRCELLGLDALVSHPGNATSGNREESLRRNADAVRAALDAVPGNTKMLFEITAGSGTALGATFEELAELIERVGPEHSGRVGVCLDTCHMWAAGYDIANDYDAVFQQFDDVVGLERIKLFHLNDSVGALGSRRDRHAHIGEGAIGHEAFRRIINDERFRDIPKLIETPKDDDILAADLKNLATLRGYRVP